MPASPAESSTKAASAHRGVSARGALACPDCGARQPAGTRRCADCRTLLSAPCPQCGRRNPVSARVCWACHNGLVPIARSAPEPPARARSEEDEDDAADESRPQPARRAHSRWPVLLVAGVLAIIVWLERDLILSGLGAVVQSVVLFAVAVWLARMVISSIGRGF